MRQKISLKRRTAPPVRVGDTVLRLESQVLRVRWPQGGLVWNRPLTVTVERDGQAERVPIVDVTRLAQAVLYGLSALFTVTALRVTREGRQHDGH